MLRPFGAVRFGSGVVGPTPVPPVESHLEMDGQSLANTPVGDPFFDKVVDALDPVWWPSSHNAAVNGTFYDNRKNGGANSASTRLDPHLSGTYLNVLVDIAGQSDIGPFGDPHTASELFTKVVSYVTERRTAGVDLYVICTIPASTFYSGLDSETQRLAYNTLLRDDVGATFDGVADIAAIPELANPSNGTYWTDGLHWTDAGAELGVAKIIDTLAGMGLAV